ncbi:MAG: hypothetical protein U0326_23915, partial [Polyangiales bacterium]
MRYTFERMTSALLLCLLAICAFAGCGDTTASAPDVNVDAPNADAAAPDADAVAPDASDGGALDIVADDGRGAPDARFDAPDPEVVTCPSAGDVPIVLLPDVVVPLDVYETCRTVLPMDAGPPCTPRTTESCTCVDGLSGTRTCRDDTLWGSCRCGVVDAGMDATLGTDGPIPRIDVPRLIAPQSGSRATSQRPTFRWVLPAGVTRARLEVCADRPCTRMLMRQEVAGTSWRSAERLPPGVAFWRVHGLGVDGSVTWTSATWEVGIRHRDLPNDTSYGTIHDFNGDGYDDVVFGIGELQGYTLRAYPGSASGLRPNEFRGMNPPYPPETILGENPGFG